MFLSSLLGSAVAWSYFWCYYY